MSFRSVNLVVKLGLVAVLMAGCADSTETKPATKPSMGNTSAPALPGENLSAPSGQSEGPPGAPDMRPLPGKIAAVPVAADPAGDVKLTPDNTRIEFVGTHAGTDPNPRTGTFTKFQGAARIDAAAKQLKSIEIDIEAGSIATPIANLTNHLNTPDFFDTREFPSIKFVSSEITDDGGEGQFSVKGDLTLHGVTKPVSFPIQTTIDEKGLTSRASFEIDRTEFGMDQVTDKVNKEVAITVIVGEKNQVPAEAAPQVDAGKAVADALAFFDRQDANQDGELVGDEIAPLMKQNMLTLDPNGDHKITRAEFESVIQRPHVREEALQKVQAANRQKP